MVNNERLLAFKWIKSLCWGNMEEFLRVTKEYNINTPIGSMFDDNILKAYKQETQKSNQMIQEVTIRTEPSSKPTGIFNLTGSLRVGEPDHPLRGEHEVNIYLMFDNKPIACTSSILGLPLIKKGDTDYLINIWNGEGRKVRIDATPFSPNLNSNNEIVILRPMSDKAVPNPISNDNDFTRTRNNWINQFYKGNEESRNWFLRLESRVRLYLADKYLNYLHIAEVTVSDNQIHYIWDCEINRAMTFEQILKEPKQIELLGTIFRVTAGFGISTIKSCITEKEILKYCSSNPKDLEDGIIAFSSCDVRKLKGYFFEKVTSMID